LLFLLEKPFSNQEESKMLYSFSTSGKIQVAETLAELTPVGEAWLVFFERDSFGCIVKVDGNPVVKEIRSVFINGRWPEVNPTMSVQEQEAVTQVPIAA
jgi:hypothetical protein